jgi:sugar lactone lactonase YvrE
MTTHSMVRKLLALGAVVVASCFCLPATAQSRFEFFGEIGNGPGSALGQFNAPSGLAFRQDAGSPAELYIADTLNNRIQRATFNPITGDPDFDLIAGPGSGMGEVMGPRGISVADVDGDALPDVVVADTGNRRVWVYPGLIIGQSRVIAGPGSGVGEVDGPQGVDGHGGGGAGGIVFVADTLNNRIQKATQNPGTLTFTWTQLEGPLALGPLNQPAGVFAQDTDANGGLDRLFVADTGNNRVLRAALDELTGDPDFDLLMGSGTGLGEVSLPGSIVVLVEDENTYFVADTGNNRVQVGVDNGNNINWEFVGGGAISMLAPGGLAVGDLTRDGRPDLVVADTGNNRLLLFAGVPEPSTMLLAAAAMAAASTLRRRQPRN